jgi:oligogalacturonide lyase
MTRRAFLPALAAIPALANSGKGAVFPTEWRQYSDPATELTVLRLTHPGCTNILPASYERIVSRNGFLLFSSDRSGALQVCRMNLKTGECRQLTDAQALDPASPSHTPDDRNFCYFDGRSLHLASVGNLRSHELYRVPEGWERCPGSSISGDGSFALLAEHRPDGGSRLQLVGLSRGAARTVVEAPWEIRDPVARPRRAQVLYRQGSEALWLVNSDGQQSRRLNLADGVVGPAAWAPDGRTILYLNFPTDRTQLNAIREFTPDENRDRLVARTSQFVHFGFNRDTSVFVGASRNAASPNLLLLLRVTQREFTLCEHRAGDPASVAPIFSPDSQTVYFQSDRHGKPAIYSMSLQKLVEETEN